MRRLPVAILTLLLACGGQVRPAPEEPSPGTSDQPSRTGERSDRDHRDAKPDNPLFPRRKRGWKVADAEQRRAIAAFAGRYATFLGRSKTPRRAIAALLEIAETGGAEILSGRAAPHRSLFAFAARGGDAAAFVRVGAHPVSEGLQIVVASVDAPRIDLKPHPIYEKAGVAMFDTFLYGDLDLASWLSQPMALYVHVSRPASAGGDVDVAIGEGPDDPVLAIPDLLPHLAGKVQRQRIVDSAERMDAIAAGSRAALAEELGRRGLHPPDLAGAEAYLVPAGPPSFVGVDRALIAGHGQRDRALAYAALRALLDREKPERTAVVIAVSKARVGGDGASGLAFARTALTRAIASAGDREQDLYDSARALARSALLIAAPLGGKPNQGVVLSMRADDSLPAAARRALERMRAAGAQVQIDRERSWNQAARELGTLDLDAVAVGLPIRGAGAPRELLSTLDLYQGYLACRGWLR